MSAAERTDLLGRWIKPSSDNEKDQQERAESMVRKAINTCSNFDGTKFIIYTKGSYPNNTNVRRDSDVDVVVELHECRYYDYAHGVIGAEPKLKPYTGPWTPDTWRQAVVKALVDAFGASSVDTSGKIAINVSAVEGSRPSADVVPSFDYCRYKNAERTDRYEGSCVFPTDGGSKVVNWPQQQFENGRSLNVDSNHRYKSYVRALKNAENYLASIGIINELPSYFMECLVFNVPAQQLTAGNLDDGFRETLRSLWGQLKSESSNRKMVEPNKMKWLFTEDKKWSLQDGKDLVQSTWAHLGYGG